MVLLILTGVAIGAIAGENGLIMRTQQAKKETRYKEAKEKINLELMEIQAECTEQRKEYNIKEIALKMKDAEEIIINKTYNKEVASISEGIQIDEQNVEAIVVSVDKCSEYKFLIGKSTKIEGVLETEDLDTIAKSDFIDIETFEKSLLKSIEKQSSIEFSYEVKERVGKKLKVAIHIQDKENGIDKIEFPDGGIIECFGRKEYARDNYEVEIGVEYKVKITSKSGETKEETILIDIDRIYLYKEGEEYEEITGGWYTDYCGGNNPNIGSATKENTYIDVKSWGIWCSYGAITTNQIDLTDVKKICFEIEECSITGTGWDAVSFGYGEYYEKSSRTSNTGTEIYSIVINGGVTGSHTVWFSSENGGNIKVKSVWLEY